MEADDATGSKDKVRPTDKVRPQDNGDPSLFDRITDSIDRRQRRLRPVAFGYAVIKRFDEDRGAQHSALLAYYGFFSLLPLLLVVSTVLARVFADDPTRQKQIIDAITDRVPVTGDTVASNVTQLRGSGLVLLVGLLFTLYGALGAMNTAQDAFNTMWGVPRFQWPNFWVRAVRSLAVVTVVGSAILVATMIAPIAAFFDLQIASRALTDVLAIVLNTVAVLLCFELSTNTRIGLKMLWPGALAGGLGLFALQRLGAWYMQLVVTRATTLYGVFAATIGLLIWIGLQARVLLLAGEINVVRSRHLWPRSLTGRGLGEADHLALEDGVARESRSDGLVVHTRVRDGHSKENRV